MYAAAMYFDIMPSKTSDSEQHRRFIVNFSLAPWASQHLFLSDVVIIRITSAVNIPTQNCTES